MTNLRKLADGMPCVRCGLVGETCLRHYNGFRAHSYGKGRGIKCSDIAAAEMCQACNDLFDEKNYHLWPGGSKSIERSEEFLHYCMMTNIRRSQR